MGVTDPAPAAFAEGDVVDGVLVVERLVEVDELVDVQFTNLTQACATRTATRGVVEREGIGVAHEWLTDTREQQTKQGINVCVCANRGA